MASLENTNNFVDSTQAPKLLNQVLFQGGYDSTFVKKPEHLQTECSVCLCLLRDPHLVECCGYRFCRTCIERVKLKNKQCPLCNVQLTTIVSDKQLQRQLNGLDVYCSNKDSGCDWTGELRTLELHVNAYEHSDDNKLNGCSFTLLACTYCDQKIQRGDLREHETEICDLRPYSCDYCNDYSSTFVDVTENHWPLCDFRPVSCPNLCGVYPERRNFKDHVDKDCSLAVINCDFDYAGCDVKLPRENMPEHLFDNMVTHISMLAITCKQQLSINKELRRELEQSKLKIVSLEKKLEQTASTTETVESMLLRYEPPIVLQMDNLSQHTSIEDQWFSPSFYSHLNGYKFCLGAMISTQPHCDVTVLFFQIYIMRGEFDEQLQWPLEAEVKVNVFFQDEELGGYFECDREIRVHNAERVITGKRSASGYSPNVCNPSFSSKNDQLSFQISKVNILN